MKYPIKVVLDTIELMIEDVRKELDGDGELKHQNYVEGQIFDRLDKIEQRLTLIDSNCETMGECIQELQKRSSSEDSASKTVPVFVDHERQ